MLRLLVVLLSLVMIPVAWADAKLGGDATATSSQNSSATQEKKRREAAKKALEALKGKKEEKPVPADNKPSGR